jgi:phospholipase A1/A2
VTRGRAAVLVGVLTAPLAALAQATGSADACRDIADTAQRLACYDRAIDAARAASARPLPLPTPVAAPVPVAATPSERPSPGSLTDRWELDPRHKRGTFAARPYKPLYVLPVVVSSAVNRSPSSPNANNVVPVTIALDRTEAKFQLSLKAKLAQGLFGDNGDIWAGYTQSSRWQVYNGDLSRPFHETNYEPEAMFVLRTDYSLFGWQGRLMGLGINHQSNGRAQPLSRSWNRVFGMVGIDNGDWSLMLRPWLRIKEDAAADDNPDIEDHIGRGELLITRTWGAHLLSLQLRHSLRGGERSRGSAEVEWAFPVAGNLRGHVQLFSGYGESLIDYNFRQTRLGLGMSLVEWR